jgi:hypothetical protein
MSCLQAVDQAASLFDYRKWSVQLPDLAKQYAKNNPVPHILLQGFLREEAASQVAQEFPRPDTHTWTQYKHHNENKLGMAKRELFPLALKAVSDELNSPQFLTWLSRLTGISDLVADPGRRRRTASIRTRRVPQCAHRFFASSLPQKLEKTDQSDPIPQSGVAAGVGGRHRALGPQDATLRRAISPIPQLRAYLQHG